MMISVIRRIFESFKQDMKLIGKRRFLKAQFLYSTILLAGVDLFFGILLTYFNIYLAIWVLAIFNSAFIYGFFDDFLWIYEGKNAIKYFTSLDKLKRKIVDKFTIPLIIGVSLHVFTVIFTIPYMWKIAEKGGIRISEVMVKYIPTRLELVLLIICAVTTYILLVSFSCYMFRLLRFLDEDEAMRYSCWKLPRFTYDRRKFNIDLFLHGLLQSLLPQIFLYFLFLGTLRGEALSLAGTFLEPFAGEVLMLIAITLNVLNTYFFWKNSDKFLRELDLEKMNLAQYLN